MLNSIYQPAYTKAMTMLKHGSGADEILRVLISAAETASGPGSVASILLLDGEGLLRNGASPRLPADYLKAIDGIRPDPNVGTCAAAAATGLPVITPSFYSDNKWAELRHLPSALGFVAAYSIPIKNAEAQVLGTFGVYLPEEGEPSVEQMSGVELLATAAADVIIRSKQWKTAVRA